MMSLRLFGLNVILLAMVDWVYTRYFCEIKSVKECVLIDLYMWRRHVNNNICYSIFVYLFPGLLDKESLKEVDEDMVSEVDLNNTVTEEEREEMENELTKVLSPMF